jgi:dTDP-4-dehydrorhamnose 3,5-epimerase
MNITAGQLEGLWILEPPFYQDVRGWSVELWNERRYREAGLPERFVQDNLSLSRQGSLRGLHFQNPCPQGKLVTVLDGEVFDVVVDIRRGSPTFGRWSAMSLSSATRRQLYVPPGFAHGFLTVSDTALFHYKCTAPYSPVDELVIQWNDPELNIAWPIGHPTLSAKDADGTMLRHIPQGRLFD